MTTTPAPLRAGRFTLEDMGTFDGFTRGDLWNGFACPFFTKAQADAIVEAHNNELEPAGWYDAGGDAYMFPFLGGWDDAQIFKATAIDGVTYYSVGGWEWTWIEETAPADTLAPTLAEPKICATCKRAMADEECGDEDPAERVCDACAGLTEAAAPIEPGTYAYDAAGNVVARLKLSGAARYSVRAAANQRALDKAIAANPAIVRAAIVETPGGTPIPFVVKGGRSSCVFAF